jgi:hypothetical protein
MPNALSWALAASTVTAMTKPRTSTASPRLRPGTFLAASFPVVAAGTFTAAWTLWVSITTRLGSSDRPAFSRTCQRSRSLIFTSVPSSRQAAK